MLLNDHSRAIVWDVFINPLLSALVLSVQEGCRFTEQSLSPSLSFVLDD